MKRFYLAAMAASLAVAIAAPMVWAGVETGPKIALHVSATTSKTSAVCTTWSPAPAPVGQNIPCSSFETHGALGLDQLVYVVVAQADTPTFNGGVAGAQFGIDYNGNDGQGVDVGTWTLCAEQGLEFPNAGPRGDFPQAGGGNLVTWAVCQEVRIGNEGIHTVIGVFQVYAYTDDKMRLTPNRNLQTGSAFKLANCAAVESTYVDSLDRLGIVGFGGATGCNPCTNAPCIVPTYPVTWGKIKSLYGH